mgnify:CR=1 FL=1
MRGGHKFVLSNRWLRLLPEAGILRGACRNYIHIRIDGLVSSEDRF